MDLSNQIINDQDIVILSSADQYTTTIINNGGLLAISSGGIATDTTVNSGGQLTVYDHGSSLSPTIIQKGGTLTVYAGSFITGAEIYGTFNVSGVGSASILEFTEHSGSILNFYTSLGNYHLNDDVISGVTYNLFAPRARILGGTYTDNTIINVYSGASAANNSMMSGGTINVYDGGSASNNFINDSGLLTISSGGIATNTTVNSGGNLNVSFGGSALSNFINDSGLLTISSGGIATDTTVNSDGSLNVSYGGQLGGVTTLNLGGSATIYPDAGGSINLVGDTNGGLTISGLENGGEVTTVVTIIDGFNGNGAGDSDAIKLAGIHAADVALVEYKDSTGADNPDFVTLTLKNGQKITLNIIGAQNAGYTLGTSDDGSLIYEVCFLAGSMIKILDGEIAVEDLRIGDQVLTYDWKENKEVTRSVQWVGNKHIIVNPNLYDDEAGYPVRILKNAIAQGVPYKDLLVTPEHCLFFNGKFIPARMLVNGTSIVYDYSITDYTYYHIETEEHSVIWANNMLTESYLNTGNRSSFRQPGSFVLFSKQSKAKSWEHDASYPLVTDRETVETIYHQLVDRAQAIGLVSKCNPVSLITDPALHLTTSTGEVIASHFHQDGKYFFNIPQNIDVVNIVSRVSRPVDTIGSFVDDRRELGVLVGNIILIDRKDTYEIIEHLSNETLMGWEPLETTTCRWTKGNAQLKLPNTQNQKKILVVNILSSNAYIIEQEEEIRKTA